MDGKWNGGSCSSSSDFNDVFWCIVILIYKLDGYVELNVNVLIFGYELICCIELFWFSMLKFGCIVLNVSIELNVVGVVC